MALSAGIAIAACGSRGPLDLGGLDEFAPLDAGHDVSTTADVGTGGEDSGSTPDAVAPADAATDARRPPPGMDGGILNIDTGIPIVNCGLCVFQQCGTQVLACFQDTACRTTLQCVTTNCLTGGTPNLGCVLQMCGGSPATLLQLEQIFTCVAGNCGASCLGLLGGGLGGGGGGGGGGRGGGPGGPPDAGAPVPLTPARRAVINEAFSAWPELCVPEDGQVPLE